MTHPQLSSRVVRFDVFEVDLQAGELRKESRKVKLQEQPFRVLSSVLERPGELVTRKDLCQKLWPADTFVDFDHGLNSAVARLREALSDSAEQPKFIETVPKRGYRFIASLIRDGSPEFPESVPAPRLQKSSATRVLIGIVAAFFMLLSAIVLGRAYPKTPPSAEIGASSRKSEVAGTPVYSPDGKQVAFRQNEGRQNDGLFTALVGGENPLRLTSNPDDFDPSWSPDNREIAFIRRSDNVLSIYIVSAAGGTEHQVYTVPDALAEGLTWSKTGKVLAFSESSTADPARSRIMVLSLTDSTTRSLTSPPDGYRDSEPAFSSDGAKIAFVRSALTGAASDVFVVAAAGGGARRLTSHDRPIAGPPAWTPDGRVMVSFTRGSPASL